MLRQKQLMNEPVRVSATLDKVTTMKDGSLKITFETQEIDDERGAALLGMRNKIGWVVFAPNGTPHVEVPDELATEFKNDKSPSQRLRSVLYIYWKQEGQRGTFDDFYRMKINRWIEAIKEKLDAA